MGHERVAKLVWVDVPEPRRGGDPPDDPTDLTTGSVVRLSLLAVTVARRDRIDSAWTAIWLHRRYRLVFGLRRASRLLVPVGLRIHSRILLVIG